jgi:DNA-binding response OmpR family regulator
LEELRQTEPLRQFRILLVEDTPQDHLLLEESFLVQGLPVAIDLFPDGEELLLLLSRESATLERYGLVVLDAHLPGETSASVLMNLRKFTADRMPPVVVLSSMIAETERALFLEHGAAQVLTKPLDLDGYVSLARRFYEILKDQPGAAGAG